MVDTTLVPADPPETTIFQVLLIGKSTDCGICTIVNPMEAFLSQWLKDCSAQQRETLIEARAFIKSNTEGLSEEINTGKWLKGYLFFSFNSTMVFALAPQGKLATTLHMMPFYGSPELQNKHRSALEPFLTGKSCIAFKRFSDLPQESLLNIVKEGTKAFLEGI